MIRILHCTLLSTALSVVIASVAMGAQPKAKTPAASAYHQQVKQLLPVAWWSFENKRADLGEVEGQIGFGQAGPSSKQFKSFTKDNLAARFGDGTKEATGVIRVEDIGPGSQFDFDNGDPITIEAWLNPDKDIRAGATMYILGKGRTQNRGQQPHNQNYGLRIFRSGNSVHLSFLFRSRTVGAHKSAWHRWDSSEGFSLGSGWHHIAVTYLFGKPESIRGYIDGGRIKGGWNPDYAGATTQPPIVDDDEIWLGSSMGRGTSVGFRGQMDEVALYRRILSEEQLTQRYPIEPYVPKFVEGTLKPGQVRMEIVEALSRTSSWPRRFGKPVISYDEDVFGFFQVPEKYSDSGVRKAWSNPFLLRAAAKINLSKGEHEWLLRVRGKGRLWLDGKVIAEINYGNFSGGAHNDVRESVIAEGKDLRYLGPGDREQLVKVTGEGRDHLVVLEMITGNGRVRTTLGETSLSARNKDGGFTLLSPGKRTVPLTDQSWEPYRRERMSYHHNLNRTRRVALRESEADYWTGRHASAREAITKKKPLRHKSIDAFLEASWAKANAAAAKTAGGIGFTQKIRPILGERCYRCHDKKSKGGLRLSSREAALEGGESETAAIIPGKPGESLLLKMIHPQAGDDIMPPKGKPLSQTERELITQWIREGASYSESGKIVPTDKTQDLEFLRRVTLDTVGVVPSQTEIAVFLKDPAKDRRTKVIDRLLADNRWADHWTAYWQDVLAENPNILKPSLNNSGPFRFWIYEGLLDNLPMDRFVTELVMMKGDSKAGGPAGFGLAAENDVPMAAKAHILGTAFLGVEMKCARCHDAPYHASKQQDLFQLAAMLNRDPIKLPASSSVPATTFEGRKPLIEITLKPGSTVEPVWPAPFAQNFLPAVNPKLLREVKDPREKLAAMITAPGNERFPKVIVNRLWKQLMGAGLVDPVDDWEASKPSHPDLLEWLARELVTNAYDQKHIARLILNSAAYQRRAMPVEPGAKPNFSAPVQRRMSAEQVVDSLFSIAGKPLVSEELTMDNDGTQSAAAMISLGHPRRAWEFTSLSNERDRPSLAIPKAQAIVDVLENFGWRPSRQEPKSVREVTPNMRQPAIVANGSLGVWVTTLSEDHAFTALATRPDLSLDKLIEQVFLRVLSRKPTSGEAQLYTDLLEEDFEQRIIPADRRKPVIRREPLRHVSWSNHLSEEANRIKIELEKRAREGDPPTVALQANWRERMEDMLWALMNSPEFIFIP